MEDKYWLVGIVVTILAFTSILHSVRFMFAHSQILFEKKTVKEAVRYSLEKTRKHSLVLYFELAWFVVITYLIFPFF